MGGDRGDHGGGGGGGGGGAGAPDLLLENYKLSFISKKKTGTSFHQEATPPHPRWSCLDP